jgi:hypothetical protein
MQMPDLLMIGWIGVFTTGIPLFSWRPGLSMVAALVSGFALNRYLGTLPTVSVESWSAHIGYVLYGSLVACLTAFGRAGCMAQKIVHSPKSRDIRAYLRGITRPNTPPSPADPPAILSHRLAA